MFAYSIFLLFVSVVVLQVYCCAASIQEKDFRLPLIGSEQIVGGSDVAIEDFPFQLSFQKNGMHICGAAIISEFWAITAAHCVNRCLFIFCRSNEDVARNFPMLPFNFPSNMSIINTIRRIRVSFSVRAGSSFVGKDGSVHDVQSIIVHPRYSHVTNDNDIALLKISPSFNFRTAVRAIPLVAEYEEPTAGNVVSVTGWGLKAENSHQVSGVLQQVSLVVVDGQSCAAAYGKITRSMICAGDVAGGRDSCQGDSGGPLVVTRKLAGIVSFGKGCGRAGFPGVYANIATLRSWIRNCTGI